jgi:hypothetical protein
MTVLHAYKLGVWKSKVVPSLLVLSTDTKASSSIEIAMASIFEPSEKQLDFVEELHVCSDY